MVFLLFMLVLPLHMKQIFCKFMAPQVKPKSTWKL